MIYRDGGSATFLVTVRVARKLDGRSEASCLKAKVRMLMSQQHVSYHTMTLQLAKHYSREEIHEAVGGSVEEYLPTLNGKVVCGAFRRDGNPDAPMVILPGFGPKIEPAATLFAEQGTAVPVFMKDAPNQWRYVGEFRVKRLSRDPEEIRKHAARARRESDVSMVLFLERATREPAG